MFKSLTFKTKLILLIFLLLMGASAISTYQTVQTINELSKNNIQKYKEDALRAKEIELKNIIQVAMNVIDAYYKRTTQEKIKSEVEYKLKAHMQQLFNKLQFTYYQFKDKLSKQELEEKLKEIVKQSRYDKRGYFWINDFNAKVIMHPLKPNIVNTSKKGIPHWDKFVEIGKLGDGFVSYIQKLNGKKYQKISYIKTFKPLNWIIGTGAYIDDYIKEIQKEALEALSKIRYGHNGYFWVNDLEPKMLMHPIKPQFVGKSLPDRKDIYGKNLFKKMVEIATNSSEGGIVRYTWEKPGFDLIQDKIAYVRKFPHWDWILGTGAYVDDIQTNITMMQSLANEKISRVLIGFVVQILLLNFLIVVLFLVNCFSPQNND